MMSILTKIPRPLKNLLVYLSYFLPDKFYTQVRFFLVFRYWPQLKTPRSFCEKINWLKLYDRNPLRAIVADRILVRDYVREKAPSCILPVHLWVGPQLTSDIWQSLPDKFVLKAYHGSGMIAVILQKREVTFKSVSGITRRWLQTDYSRKAREWVYHKLPKLIIAEEFIDIESERVPMDFKFLCFNGHVELIMVDIDRFTKHRRNLYDRKFRKMNAEHFFPSGPDIPKPDILNHAIQIAESLAVPFDFIRVDLYISKDAVYFGEMTCFPEAGFGHFKPKSLDFLFGERLKLHTESTPLGRQSVNE